MMHSELRCLERLDRGRGLLGFSGERSVGAVCPHVSDTHGWRRKR